MSRQAHKRFSILLVGASVATGIGSATVVHRYIERPGVFSPLLWEGGTFTVDLFRNGVELSHLDDWSVPKPGEDPTLTSFCQVSRNLVLKRKCPKSIRFDVFCRNGPWYPSGWPFTSRAHGFLVSLYEMDCTELVCPKYKEIIIAEGGGSRFQLAGFVGNSVVYSASAFILIMVLRHVRAFVMRRRLRGRGGFPVTIVEPVDHHP